MPEIERSCPFVGVRPFSEQDSGYFFGRDAEIQLVAANLLSARVTILHGRSGVGKSSLLRAGVVPAARRKVHEGSKREPGVAVAYFHRWDPATFLVDLKGECHAALYAASGRAVAAAPTLPLDELLDEAARTFQGSLLVILDQFEQYLVQASDRPGGQQFEAELARAINRRGMRAAFLIALREENLALLDERFRLRIPGLLGRMVRLRGLDRTSAESAIRGPLKEFEKRGQGYAGPTEIETELCEELIAEAMRSGAALSETSGRARTADSADTVDTFVLQLLLAELWRKEKSSGSLLMRAQTLKAEGQGRQIVERYVDQMLAGLSPEEQRICSRMFRYIVTPSGTNVAQSVADLAVHAGQPEPVVDGLLAKLDGGLLKRLDGRRYQFSHDRLAHAALHWRNRFEQAAREAELAKELEAERAESARRARDARRLRWLSAAAIAGLVAAVIGLIIALRFYRDKLDTAKELAAKELEVAAANVREADLMLRLANAALSLQRNDAATVRQLETDKATARLSSEAASVLPSGDDAGETTETATSEERERLRTAATAAEQEAKETAKRLEASREERPALENKLAEASNAIASDPQRAEALIRDVAASLPPVTGNVSAVESKSVPLDDLLARIASFNWRRQIQSVHFHHTVSPKKRDFRGESTIAAIQLIGSVITGSRDGGHHLFIGPDGSLWLGQDWNLSPTSIRGYNGSATKGPFSIALIGNFDTGEDELESVQREPALRVIAAMLRRWGLTAEEGLKFHRDMGATRTCPGSAIDRDDMVAAINEILTGGAAVPAAASARQGAAVAPP